MGHYLKLYEPKAGVPKLDNEHGILKRWRIAFTKQPIDDDGEEVLALTHWSKRFIEAQEGNHLDQIARLFHEVSHVAAPDNSEHPILRIDKNHVRLLLWYLYHYGEELLEEVQDKKPRLN